MKFYFCVFTQYSYHTGEAIGKTCCVVEASDKEEAKTKSYDLCGNDNSALSSVEEFNPSEDIHTRSIAVRLHEEGDYETILERSRYAKQKIHD